MIQLPIKEVSALLNATIVGDENAHFQGISIDTRNINANNLFVAINGEKYDGHDFVYLSQLAAPSIALITHAGAAHLEGVGSIKGVAVAKAEIFTGLQAGGFAILNKDDDFYDYWRQETASFKQISFGFDTTADVTA